jgi:hypothetical protein
MKIYENVIKHGKQRQASAPIHHSAYPINTPRDIISQYDNEYSSNLGIS